MKLRPVFHFGLYRVSQKKVCFKNSKKNFLFQKSKCTHVSSINLKGKMSDTKNIVIALIYFCNNPYETPCINQSEILGATSSIIRYYSRGTKGDAWLLWRCRFTINSFQVLKTGFRLIGSHSRHGFTINFVPRFIGP